MKLKQDKYLFIVTNTFSLLYFLYLIKYNKLNSYNLIINNEKDFFRKSWFDKVFKKNGINFTIISWSKKRKFPFSIIDIARYKYLELRSLNKFKWYKVILWHDVILSDKLILQKLNKKNTLFYFINNNFILDNPLPKRGYDYYLKFLFNISMNRKLWESFSYKKKIYIEDIDKEGFINNLDSLRKIFADKVKLLNDTVKKKSNVIFLSQNIIWECWIPQKVYVKTINNIKDYYENKWYSFFVKPHPLEDIKVYDWYNIINKYIPSEFFNLLEEKKDIVYITFFSSVILNIFNWNKKLIWDIWFNKYDLEIINKLNTHFKIPYLDIWERY